MRTPNNERLGSGIADAPPPREGNTFAGGAPGHAQAAPERRCILTGAHGPRARLVRLAISPAGDVLPDIHAKAPGRGAWLAVDRAALAAAMGPKGKLKGALARAFKGAPLTVPDDLPQRIEDGLTRALLDRLGLELRAGFVLLGSDRIAEHCRGGAAELLLHASDASADGRRKLDQAWRVGREIEGSGETGLVLPLDRTALSVALGRDNVVHLALAEPAAAARVSLAAERLMHFLGATKAAPDGGEPDDRPLATTD